MTAGRGIPGGQERKAKAGALMRMPQNKVLPLGSYVEFQGEMGGKGSQELWSQKGTRARQMVSEGADYGKLFNLCKKG